ncbi:PREDICTED: carbohydrate sulfotransferase 11 isoform X2 [Nicrophorus vespilloides]|uniref:Carbohydrate sulfotransferase n=1 Tax=Nicrophorus vespilloides TaxID=110193 RepID=A0ABM1MJE5_NICVS|nr:PREDICTED: carbohydrate sulfotransferase 11 isoform X2 [Nicrophorus vespilloides]
MSSSMTTESEGAAGGDDNNGGSGKKEKSLKEEIESLSHEDLCEVTQSSLKRIIATDSLLSDLPTDVTTEEVLAQVAVVQGQSVTINILRNLDTSFSVVVACTNWKRVLMVLTGKSNATDLVGISASLAHSDGALEKLTDLPSEEALSVLNNYTSFMMVRHPFERLLSAYRNKLEDDKASARYFQGIFGRHIIKNYRKDPKAEDIRTGANVTFKEFVQYLIAEGVDDDTANEHWRSMDRLCRPCQLNYTFIGKYDTFAEDAEVVLGMIKAPKLIFPQTRSGRTAERIRLYYQKLSLEEIEMLYKIYRKDFKYFGYGLDNVLGYDIG